MKTLLTLAPVIALAFSTAARAAKPSHDFDDDARRHWAFQPVKAPALPAVKTTAWVKTPVDAFILAQLEAKGMKPSPPASRETLLRRVTFDLIGLPPTTDELRAFLADTSPNAFANVVDRLLRSPHFGERWGRHWLDTARYSDTAGQVALLNSRDGYRYPYAWSYRDYVIGAFNDDKPYDQFIVEQIAADKLPHAKGAPALAALGFLTVGERFANKNDIINDRIDTVTKGFLGLTVACARCHDHKFDPVPTEDYYSLHGVFSSSIEPVERPLITMTKDTALLADYQAKLHAIEERNRDLYFETVEKINGSFRRNAAEFLLNSRSHGGARMEPSTTPASGRAGRTMQPQGDTTGGNPSGTRGGQPQQPEQKMSPANGHAGRATPMQPLPMQPSAMGDDKIAASLPAGARADDPVWGPWLMFAQRTPDEIARNGKSYAAEIAAHAGWNAILAAQFKGAAPTSLADVAAIYGAAFARADAQAKKFLAVKRASATTKIAGFHPALAELIEKPLPLLPGGTLSTERMRDAILQWPRGLRSAAPAAFEALSAVGELDISHPAAPAHAMVVEDSPAPADSPVFIRGQAQVRGDIVPRRFLEILSDPNRAAFKDGSGRLELARAIASKANPLTARVLVNRVWMHLFGEGFVRTPDDLGVRSEKPSHPELLDWLASAFMESGWSQKKIIRLVVLSNVYQQSCDENPDCAKLDSGNRLLWRANLRRLDFEAIRDSLLVFSGRLDAAPGGKPVNLTDEPYSFRRSVYGYVDRGNLPELMQHFDFSDPDMPNSKRASTVVPQQALFLMNSPMAVDVARKMIARKEFTAAPDDERRIAALYNIIFQRAPRPAEARLGLDYLADAKRTTGNAPVVATSQPSDSRRRAPSVEPGRAPVKNEGEKVDRRPLTPWERYAQALLFANELIYVN